MHMCHKRINIECVRKNEPVTPSTVHFIRCYFGLKHLVKYCYRLLQDGTRDSRITTPHGCPYLRTFIVPPTTLCHYNPLLF